MRIRKQNNTRASNITVRYSPTQPLICRTGDLPRQPINSRAGATQLPGCHVFVFCCGPKSKSSYTEYVLDKQDVIVNGREDR